MIVSLNNMIRDFEITLVSGNLTLGKMTFVWLDWLLLFDTVVLDIALYPSNEGLTLKMSALETIYGGKFTISTQLIKPNYLAVPSP